MDSRRWQPVALAVLVLAAFSNSFSGAFFFDDYPAIVENPHLRDWRTAWDAPDESPVAGRPVVALTLALNHAVSGLQPWSYHVVNVTIHLANVWLVLGLVRWVEDGRARQGAPTITGDLALPVAALWAVHPLVTESVNYVTQRTELLFGFCLLLTLYCFVRRWHVGSVVACAVGMLCKETMVVAPVVVALFDRACSAKSDRPRKPYYAGLAATWLVLASWVASGARSETVGFHFRELTWWQYLFTQGGVILHYLRLSVWPHPLVVDYDDWPIATGVTWPAAVVAVLVVACGWLAWRKPRWGFFAAWFFLILAPTSSVLPIASELAAERRMYLPLLAVIVPVAWTLRTRWLWVAMAAVLACATWVRNRDYRTELTIMTDTVAKRPQNTRALTNLGVALVRAGRMDAAVPHLEHAVKLNPRQADAHFNLAMIRAEQKRWRDSARHLAVVVELEPGNVRARAALETVQRLMTQTAE